MLTTFLFVPAHDARKVTKALASAADAVILDLEDAVPEQMKQGARESAAQTVSSVSGPGPKIWVRVNGSQSSHHHADVRAIDWRAAAGLVVPKAEDPASLRALSSRGLSGLLLTIESVAGLSCADDLVAASPVTPRLTLGTWDLAHDLGLIVDDPDQSELIWHIRSQVVITSRKLRLLPPVDGVYGRIDDAQGFEAMADRAFRLGYGGKLLIHPAQIPIASRVFGASEAQLDDARELIAAYDEAQRAGTGAIRHRGQMVDRVHVEKARALLARWSPAHRQP
jgi:citrate lyase subunit beta/citryl-CoA lyase